MSSKSIENGCLLFFYVFFGVVTISIFTWGCGQKGFIVGVVLSLLFAATGSSHGDDEIEKDE